VSAIQLIKWLLISPKAGKLRSASADMVSRVHPNTIKMFGKESGSPNTKDFIKVSGKSALSDCFDHILIPHYLITSQLAGRYGMIQINVGETSLV